PAVSGPAGRTISRCTYGSNINAAPAISVGTKAPRKRYSGEIPASPNRDARMDWPAGFGELAITVSPPPVTAPAITTYLSASENPGTRDARYVIAALSLKAVRIVAASINGHLLKVPRTGPIHHC